MTEPLFTGVGVALVTLFDDRLDVDAAATADHAARLVGLGIQAVVVAGSTGEAASLDTGERTQLVGAVAAAVGDRVPVVAGTGAPSARQAAELTRAAVDAGAHGVLALSPPATLDSRPYYEVVAAAAGAVPVLAYHFPAVSAPGIPVERLAELRVSGLKDSSGDPNRLLATLGAFGGHVYVGSSALLVQAGAVGAAGAILALANAEPEDCLAAWAGDGEAQRRLAGPHATAAASFPAGIKRLAADRFGTPTHRRMG